MNEHYQVDYQILTEFAEHYNLDITAAELHGIITGAVCTVGQYANDDDWIRLVTPFPENDPASAEIMADFAKILYNLTHQALNGTQLEFEPALPDIDTQIEFRVQELAAWCRGFILAYRHISGRDDQLEDDSREFLVDLGELALVEIGNTEESDQDSSLTELEEYVRVGVQNIFEDLNTSRTIH